jgi:hypothetical protein
MRAGTRISLALAALLAGTGALAADIDGKWTATVAQSEITFEFKADGEKLTGTLNNAAMAGATEIKEGTIKGNAVSFHVVRSINNAETKVPWTGTLAGDELKLQRGAAGGSEATEAVAKRVK